MTTRGRAKFIHFRAFIVAYWKKFVGQIKERLVETIFLAIILRRHSRTFIAILRRKLEKNSSCATGGM